MRSALLYLCLLFPAHLHAQGALGSITGTVKDTSNAVIPGATVKVTNEPTGTSETPITGETGYF